MNKDKFPFGKNPRSISSWLSHGSTLSATWSVVYCSGLSLACGKHTFIFLGRENLQIGVVHFVGCGPQISAGVKMTKGTSAGGRIRNNGIERWAEDAAQEAINFDDYFGDVQNVKEADTGLKLSKLLDKNASYFQTRVPISFNDINAAWGTLRGFSVDIMIAGAQLYNFDMGPDIFEDKDANREYVSKGPAYNLDDGSIGATIGQMEGKWVVDRTYDLWKEASELALAHYGFDRRPAEIPTIPFSSPAHIMPNSIIPSQIHPFLRELPVWNYPIPEYLIEKYFPELALEGVTN